VSFTPDVDWVRQECARLGYVVFTGYLNLTLVGVRNASRTSDLWDDWVGAVYQDSNGSWQASLFQATTDPGRAWLRKPGRRAGTAILVPGQHRGSHAVGLHRGKYKAMKARKLLPVWRDADKDDYLDFHQGPVYNDGTGINIHRASLRGSAVRVGSYSAGCQVIRKPGDWTDFLDLVDASAARYGSVFSYTLLEAPR